MPTDGIQHEPVQRLTEFLLTASDAEYWEGKGESTRPSIAHCLLGRPMIQSDLCHVRDKQKCIQMPLVHCGAGPWEVWQVAPCFPEDTCAQ